MVDIVGPTDFVARVQRAMAKLDPSEYSNAGTIAYGGSRPGYRAMGGNGITIYDVGLADDDVGLASLIAHENVHCGFTLDEGPAVAAEAAVLRRNGQSARGDAAEAYGKSPEYAAAVNAFHGVSGAAAQPAQPQAAQQPAQQPAEAAPAHAWDAPGIPKWVRDHRQLQYDRAQAKKARRGG